MFSVCRSFSTRRNADVLLPAVGGSDVPRPRGGQSSCGLTPAFLAVPPGSRPCPTSPRPDTPPCFGWGPPAGPLCSFLSLPHLLRLCFLSPSPVPPAPPRGLLPFQWKRSLEGRSATALGTRPGAPGHLSAPVLSSARRGVCSSRLARVTPPPRQPLCLSTCVSGARA